MRRGGKARESARGGQKKERLKREKKKKRKKKKKKRKKKKKFQVREIYKIEEESLSSTTPYLSTPHPSAPLRRRLLPVQLRPLVPLPPAVVEDQRVVRVAGVPPPPLDLGRGCLVELLPLAALLVSPALGLGLVLLLVVGCCRSACSRRARWAGTGDLSWRERRSWSLKRRLSEKELSRGKEKSISLFQSAFRAVFPHCFPCKSRLLIPQMHLLALGRRAPFPGTGTGGIGPPAPPDQRRRRGRDHREARQRAPGVRGRGFLPGEVVE